MEVVKFMRPAVLASGAAAMLWGSAAAMALEVLPDEKAGREACEKSFCTMVVKREAGGPLTCDMVKTWDRDKIKKGGESGKLSWGFGDARCSVKLDVARDPLLAALKEPKYTLEVPAQTVSCEIEGTDGKATTLTVSAAPKIEFEGGKASKIWLNVGKIDGDSIISNVIWAGAKLFDGVGVLHGPAITEINRFMFEQCAKELAAN